ncbi:MAG: hypothetical protein VB021_01810 [Oscillospiraceae bacterium]|nr:hypothetical protein [Oscillospiraceae bacterium]
MVLAQEIGKNMFAEGLDETASRIRSRIEETEMQNCLESFMGGYTRKSVQKYVARMKKQQQQSSENFNLEMKRVLDEKEQLAGDNARLSQKIEKLEEDCRTIADTAAQGPGFTAQDVEQLKAALEALRAENASLSAQLREKQETVARLDADAKNAALAAQRAAQEAQACQELLAAEKKESAVQKNAATQLYAQLSESRAQAEYLKKILADGNPAELKTAVTGLTQALAIKEKIIAGKDAQIEALGREKQTIGDQMAELRATAAKLSGAAGSLMQQNEQLAAANRALADKMNEAASQTILLLDEKSKLAVEKLQAERALEAARLQLSGGAQN